MLARPHGQLERVLGARINELDRVRDFETGTLEGAAVVTSVQGGEVLALAGGRDPHFAGFNRALDAQRQVGSLLKPAVYLTALEQPEKYTLATLLDDSPLTYTSTCCNGLCGRFILPGNHQHIAVRQRFYVMM